MDNIGPSTLTWVSTVSGKHHYSNVTDGIYLRYSGTRWEIAYNASFSPVGYYSTKSTLSNPPNFTFGAWVDNLPVGGGPAGPSDGTTMTALSGSGTTSTILPIELVAFEAKTASNGSLLSWTTASEKNNQGFDIERSLDGTDFQKIAFVKGAGTTNSVQQYTYTDASVQSITYYRLKQVDTDGKFEYSKVVSVESDARSTGRVKPTFVKDVLTVEGATSYEIVDGTGRVLLQSIENQLNVQSLPQGFYVVRGRDVGGNPFIQKIIKN
jgi:hypothetical protein